MKKLQLKELQELIKTCKNKAEFCRALDLKPQGGNYRVIDNLIKDNNLDNSHFIIEPWNKGKHYLTQQRTLDEILIKNSPHKNTWKLKNRLIKEGLKEYKCEKCGFTDKVELHHINGDPTDNRLENLQMLCPNCHSLTENYRARNISGRIHEDPKNLYITKEEAQKRDELRRQKKNEERRVKPENRKIHPRGLRKCDYCGKEFKPGEKTTKFCSVECYRETTKGNRPTLLQLIQDFKETQSFVKLGEKYGVTDNATRRWCKFYGLPHNTKELQQYINDNFGGTFKIAQPKVLQNRIKFIEQYDIQGNLLNTFENAKKAGDYIVKIQNLSIAGKSAAKSIICCANGQLRLAYGFIWKKKA